ncbi:MAG: phosphatidate cytidylyltransferase [Fusobacteriaceae bacterium]
MLNRILIALLGIPALAYIYYNGGIPLLIFTNLIVGIALHEFYNMATLSGKKCYKNFGIVSGLAIVNYTYFKDVIGFSYDSFQLIVPITILLMVYRVMKNKVEDSSSEIGITILGLIYIGFFFSNILLISALPNGGKWLLVLQILVWVCDSFAYFTGLNFGRKIFKDGFSKISPKKSVEGALGGLFFTVVSLLLIEKYFSLFQNSVSLGTIIVLGITLSMFIQIGDLVESLFKREFKIKDSGRILGEHGGILDRFDSLIFVLPIAYMFISYLVKG